jgi:hypothetical protein
MNEKQQRIFVMITVCMQPLSNKRGARHMEGGGERGVI